MPDNNLRYLEHLEDYIRPSIFSFTIISERARVRNVYVRIGSMFDVRRTQFYPPAFAWDALMSIQHYFYFRPCIAFCSLFLIVYLSPLHSTICLQIGHFAIKGQWMAAYILFLLFLFRLLLLLLSLYFSAASQRFSIPAFMHPRSMVWFGPYTKRINRNVFDHRL